MAQLECSVPVAVIGILCDDPSEKVLATQAELGKRVEYGASSELVEVLQGAMSLDDVIEQEDLLFGLDTSRGGCVVRSFCLDMSVRSSVLTDTYLFGCLRSPFYLFLCQHAVELPLLWGRLWTCLEMSARPSSQECPY